MLNPSDTLPQDHAAASLIGRLWLPGKGPVLIAATAEGLFDLSSIARTSSELLDHPDAAARVRAVLASGQLRPLATLESALANSDETRRDPSQPWLLAPCDLQAVKAAGVTFVASMLERVIEEQARGNPAKAESVRQAVVAIIGENLRSLVPGSPQALQLKEVLLEKGVWSQYLEVGIGPDAEVFTKAQPMSAVGTGAQVGLHPGSHWNNPEPEIVLAVDSRGKVVGATLGNDVNLRDFEGRSALLLGKAKDNNASCAIGPFIRLFDRDFGIDDVRGCEIALRVAGIDGFTLAGRSAMSQISRDPLDLVQHAMGPYHQYPDGMVLFLGTMFAPTQDRDGPGQGFTHHEGDVVTISTPRLGALVNRVTLADRAAPWTYGTAALMRDLARREPSSAQIPVLEKRRLQAQVIKPIWEELARRLGESEARDVLDKAIRTAAIEEGRALAAASPGGDTSMPAFIKLYDNWKTGGALETDTLKADSERFDFDVTRCRYAEMYREMGLEAIGDLLSCNRDGTFVEGYNPAITMERDQTIMQGHARCTFRYRMNRKPG
jgi:fumarylacetoacetate (FAA) hydrolase family protein